MTQTQKHLSIIIPFYDETAFLRMAVRSVLSQGLGEVEVIVVNDNPAQFTGRDIAALDLPGAVRVLHHQANRGLPAARNTGIAASAGNWIGFLDADDYYLTDGLARQWHLAKSSGACITQANCLLTRHGLPDQVPLTRENDLFAKSRTGAGLLNLEEAQFFTSSWSSLYRRDFLDRDALRFDEAQVKFEDRLFVLQTVTAARKIALLGQANRVWRRRSGSISVSKPDAAVLLLQVQLLEKCLGHMRDYCRDRPGTLRLFKREAFNTVSRLIWDIELIPALAEHDPAVQDLGPRIVALMNECNLGHQIFDDPVVRRISRVGMNTKKGMIRRVDYFAVAKALRDNDFAAAAAVMAARKPVAAAPRAVRVATGPRLVLHLGLHKTGSTALQTLMAEHRADLRLAGVLFPRTGYAGPDFAAVRAQGNPGHLGLLNAHRRGEDAVWTSLGREVEKSGCDTVVISCENMILPMDPDRDQTLSDLIGRFSRFREVDVVAFVRRPDIWAEMFFRELVSNGNRLGARSLAEFLVDYRGLLTDLPALFAPFEAGLGKQVSLIDHDASAAGNEHWARFVAAARLPRSLLDLRPNGMERVYASPSRDEILAAQLLTSLVAGPAQRLMALRGFFAGLEGGKDGAASLLSPPVRVGLLRDFAGKSAAFGAARGYAPDLTGLGERIAAEDWTPVATIPFDLLERVGHAFTQTATEPEVDGPLPSRPDRTGRLSPGNPDALTISIKMRPWLRWLMDRLPRR